MRGNLQVTNRRVRVLAIDPATVVVALQIELARVAVGNALDADLIVRQAMDDVLECETCPRVNRFTEGPNRPRLRLTDSIVGPCQQHTDAQALQEFAVILKCNRKVGHYVLQGLDRVEAGRCDNGICMKLNG